MLVPGNIVPASFDILVNDVRCHGPNFNETIVLNENCVTSEISMENRGITCSVKIAAKRYTFYLECEYQYDLVFPQLT